MLFSLLIANYNNGKYFKDCYNSIIAQTYTHWEAIIVDDGSTDDSIELIKHLIKNDERFKLYENDKNYGCGYTKRKCVDLAEGAVCGFLDPDDALEKDALINCFKIYDNDSSIILTHSDFYYCNENLIVERVSDTTKETDSENPFFFNLDYSVFVFVSFLKQKYCQTEGIDPYLKRAVDQDLYLKLAEVGKFKYIKAPLYLYRIHTNGLTAGAKSKYWHWFVIMQAAKRRNLNIEELFTNNFIDRKKFDKLKEKLHKSNSNRGSNFAKFLIKKISSFV